MKNKKALFGLFAFLSIAVVGAGAFLLMRKKKVQNNLKPEEKELVTTEDEAVEEAVTSSGAETKDIFKPVEVVEAEIYEIPKPTWFTPEMEKKFKGNYQGYKSGRDAIQQKYNKWKSDWPGAAIFVDDLDDYCIESAIQDIEAIYKLSPLQGHQLRRYYGIGRDELLPKNKSGQKPSWLNSNNLEYHMWWYFNYFLHEKKFGNIQDSFYKGLESMAKDKGISSDKIKAAKDYYDTSQLI